MSSFASLPLSRIERVQLLDEKRHAVGPFGDAVDETIEDPAEDRSDEQAYLLVGQAADRHAGHVRDPLRPIRRPVRTVGQQHVNGRPMHPQNNVPQKLVGRRVDPMRILDREQHGSSLRSEEGAIGERPQGQFLALKSGEIGQFGGVAQIERQEPVIDRPHVGHEFPISRDEAVELFGASRRIVIRSKAN